MLTALKPAHLLTLVALLATLQTTLNDRLIAHAPRGEQQSSADGSRFRWNPALFRLITFGQLPSVVSWLWIRALADPGEAMSATGQHPNFYYDVDLLTQLDPANLEAYLAAGYLLSLPLEDPQGAQEILQRGAAYLKAEVPALPAEFQKSHWQLAWRLPIALAYVEMFELNNLPRAKEAIRQAASFEDAPLFAHDLAKRFEKKGGEYDVGARLLKTLLKSTTDERIRKGLEQKQRSLYLSQFLVDTNRLFHEYLATLPELRGKSQILQSRLETLWKRFLKDTGQTQLDPFGGTLSVNREGRVVTTTPYQSVFGLE